MSDTRYEQLIADLGSTYRPQREWGEGRGILMVVGHFLVGVAGGTWLMASIYGVTSGLVIAFGLGALGALVHLMFLGRPERAIGMMRNVRSSWISRGFVGLSLFLAGGGLYLATLLLPATGGWALLAIAAKVVAAVGTLAIIGYMGFCYTASKAIPFWHSPLHPAIYIAFAIRGGLAVLLVIAAATGMPASAGLLPLWAGVTALVSLFFLIEIKGALSSGNLAARWAVRDMLAGRLAASFYGGTLAIGLVVPVLLLATSAGHSPVVMALIGIASVSGDFFMKLSTVKAGVYLPLMLPAGR